MKAEKNRQKQEKRAARRRIVKRHLRALRKRALKRIKRAKAHTKSETDG